jgi:hypothetical protein
MANYVTWEEADSIITDSRWLALTIAEKEKFILNLQFLKRHRNNKK